MTNHIWTVVCRTSIQDNETHNWSLIEALDNIDLEIEARLGRFVPGLPYTFVWLSFWRREDINKPDSVYGKDVVLEPSGRIVYEDEYRINLVKHQAIYHERKVHDIDFTESGDYRFITHSRTKADDSWTIVSNIPIIVLVKEKRRKRQRAII